MLWKSWVICRKWRLKKCVRIFVQGIMVTEKNKWEETEIFRTIRFAKLLELLKVCILSVHLNTESSQNLGLDTYHLSGIN